MLASIIANLQNVSQPEAPSRPTRLPMVKIDRGGGGGTPDYDVTDVMAAIRSFPEIAGEDAFTRAVRRSRWIDAILPHVRQVRERREAGVFLSGLNFGYAAGYEAGVAAMTAQPVASEMHVPMTLQVPLHLTTTVPEPAPARVDRGESSGGGGGAGLVIAALAIGTIGFLALRFRKTGKRS